ncbi:MAG: hypothetical protein QGH45_12795 [Myxococcota bacterium]|nr:hypothetical protein [Myxococcota bacterium]
MTTFLLATVLVLTAMAMLGIGVLLGRDRPLRGSCQSIGDGCDDCRCAAPGVRDPMD